MIRALYIPPVSAMVKIFFPFKAAFKKSTLRSFIFLLIVVFNASSCKTHKDAFVILSGSENEPLEPIIKEAKARLTKIAKTAKIPAKQQVLKIGIARSIILDQAKKLKADLIIVGSHGRHGVKTLLGSTANAILHNAACDVLAVRVK